MPLEDVRLPSAETSRFGILFPVGSGSDSIVECIEASYKLPSQIKSSRTSIGFLHAVRRSVGGAPSRRAGCSEKCHDSARRNPAGTCEAIDVGNHGVPCRSAQRVVRLNVWKRRKRRVGISESCERDCERGCGQRRSQCRLKKGRRVFHGETNGFSESIRINDNALFTISYFLFDLFNSFVNSLFRSIPSKFSTEHINVLKLFDESCGFEYHARRNPE